MRIEIEVNSIGAGMRGALRSIQGNLSTRRD